MPATRSGSRYTVGPEHHGRYARQEGVLSKRQKREAFGQRRATRFQTGQRQQKRMQLANPGPPTPTRDAIITLERATRSTNPTCLHFGLELEVRQFLYPNHFFCAHCDDFVDAMIHGSNKKAIKRDSRRFICRGQHTNFIAPTTLKEDKQHFRLFAEIADLDADEIVDEHLEEMSVSDERDYLTPATPAMNRATRTTVTPAAPTPAPPVPPALENTPAVNNDVLRRNLQADYETLLGQERTNVDQLKEFESQIQQLSEQLNRQSTDNGLQEKYNNLLERYQSLRLQIRDPKLLVSRAINLPFDEDEEEFDGFEAVIGDTKVKKQKKVRQFVLMITQSLFFNGIVREEILKEAKRIIREEIYTPWKILRLKDKSGGKLSIDTIDILRQLETDGKKYVRNTILQQH